MKKNRKKAFLAITIGALVCLLLFTDVGMRLSHLVGYKSGFQGLEMTWNSVYYKNYWYDSSHYGPNPNYNNKYASAHSFVEALDFDADEMNDMLPNIGGSISVISVDRDVAPIIYGPWQIKVGEEWVKQWNATHSWYVKRDIYKEFQVNRYKCDAEINLWLSGSASEAKPDGYERHYQQADIWMQVIPQAFCYFEDNPEKVFFAPALMEVQFVKYLYGGKENSDCEEDQQLYPHDPGDVFYIYYEKGGGEVNMEDTVLQYQGALLDPNIFRTCYWTRFHLIDFYGHSGWQSIPGGGWWYTYPSLWFQLRIYVFVVGEWTVKLFTDERTRLEPHKTQSQTGSIFSGIADWISNALSNPWTWVFIIIAIIVVCFVVFMLLGGGGLLMLKAYKGGEGGAKRGIFIWGKDYE